jgi:predicted RND superfamily exporter protein
MGVAGFLGIPLSPPSVTAPNIILTLATADCIHIIWSAMRNVGYGMEKREAIRRSLRDNFSPIFFTSAASAVGFLALTFSESPPFQHLGLIAGIGVILAWALSISLLPALMVWCPLKARRSAAVLTSVFDFLFRFIQPRAKLICALSLVVTATLAACAFTNTLDDRFVNYFDDSFEFRRDTDYMSDNLTGIYYVDFSLRATDASGIANPEYLKEVEAFADWLRLQPEVRHVEGLTDVFKILNQAFNDGNDDAYRVPEDAALAAQFLFFYELSLPHGLDLKDRITLDKAATRLTATLENTSTSAVLSLLERSDAWMAANFQNIQSATGTGTTVLFSHIGMRNIQEMLIGTAFSFIGISILLFLVFRSVGLGLLGFLTNVMPAMTVMGAWALIVGEVGMAVAVIAAMTLGIVVDDTIHLISRYLKARREDSKPVEAAVREAMLHSGPALLTTTIVLASGFFCLAFSGFQINAWLGLMTAITIITALVFDILVIPSTLIIAGKRSHAKDTTDVLDPLDIKRAELGRNA